jgi:hypothetical protein
MNYLRTPEAMIHDNAAMDPEQRQAAGVIVEELLDLRVVQLARDGRQVVTRAPLFGVPKEGQEGQWQVISDVLRGSQNECITGDPVFLPWISHTLDQMYLGGFLAVVDLSKYFYKFPRYLDDRPYLGLKHPITGVLLEYTGLPLGRANSPAIACRYMVQRLYKCQKNNSRNSKVTQRSTAGGLSFPKQATNPTSAMVSV